MRVSALAILLLALLSLAGMSHALTTVSSCINITSPDTYELTTGLSGAPNPATPLSDYACIKVASSNVILDCKGYALTGPGSNYNYGILVNGSVDNVTVRNCNVGDYYYNIYTYNSTNVSIINSNTSTRGEGIVFYLSSYFSAVSSKASSNGYAGFYVSDSSYGTIANSTAYNIQMGDGFVASGSDHVNFTGNNATMIGAWWSSSAFSVASSDYVSVAGNIADNITGNGIDLSSSNYGTYSGNKIYNASDGIYVSASQYNVFSGNNITESQGDGVELQGSPYNNFTNNVVTVTRDGYAFDLYESNYTRYAGNNITDALGGFSLYLTTYYAFINNSVVNPNAYNGFDLDGVTYGNITGNTVNTSAAGNGFMFLAWGNPSTNNLVKDNLATNVYIGFYLDQDNSYNVLDNNVASGNVQDGIYLYGSSGNNLTWNTAYGNADGIDLESGSNGNNLFNNTAFDSTGAYGFDIAGSYNLLIDNEAYNNPIAGIDIYDASNNTLIRNIAHDNPGDGFYVSSSDNVTLTDNLAYENGQDGFNLGGTNLRIFNNTGHDTSGSYDAFVFAGSYFVAVGNLAYDNPYHGFNVAGSSNIVANNTLYSNGIAIWAQGSNNSLEGNEIYSNGGAVTSYGGANITGNRMYNNGGGITFYNGFTDLAGNSISGCSGTALTYSYTGGGVTVNGDHYFNNSADVEVNTIGNPVNLNLTNVILDNPLGDFQNFTNLTFSDTQPGGPSVRYILKWAPVAPVPSGQASFASKYVNLTTISGSPSIDSIIWSWDDAELGGYNESVFALWKYNSSGWTVLNNTPDTAANRLSLSNVASFSGFGILQENATNCPVITVPGTYAQASNYTGAPNNASEVGPPGSFACVKIASSDVVFDCNGFKIQGGGASATRLGIAINGSFTNVTVKNCNVSNYTYAIYLGNAANSAAINNTVYNNSYGGIFIDSSASGITLSNNTAYRTSYDGFSIGGSSIAMADNVAHSNGRAGFWLSCSNANLTSNTAYNNTQNGFYLISVSNANLVRNRAYNNRGGFDLSSAPGNTLVNNTAYNNSAVGFNLTSSSFNRLINNTANGSVLGFALWSSGDNNLTDNTAEYIGTTGFRFYYAASARNRITHNLARNVTVFAGFETLLAENNTFANNTAHDALVGIQVSSGPYNVFINNTVYSNRMAGFRIYTVNYTSFINNTVYGNVDPAVSDGHGFLIGGSSHNNFTGNVVHDNGDRLIPVGDGFHAVVNGPTVSRLNIFYNNTVYNNGFAAFYLSSSTNNSIANNSAYGNGVAGAYIRNSADNAVSSGHYYNNANDFFLLEDTGSPFHIALSNVIIDNPSGNFQNFTNLSLDDTVEASSSYAINWTSTPSLPLAYASFAGKTVRISVMGGSPSIDSIVWTWSNAELTGYNESRFSLQKYNGTWNMVNSTPDTAANQLSLSNVASFSSFGILQENATNCPVITSPGVYAQEANYSGDPNSAAPLSGTACVVIASSDVVFDCGGFYLNGPGVNYNYGILVNGSVDNVTVRNCNVDDYYYNIYTYNSTNVSIINTTASARGVGFTFYLSSYFSAIGDSASGNSYGGFYVSDSDYGRLENNSATTIEMGNAFDVSGSDFVNLTWNNATYIGDWTYSPPYAGGYHLDTSNNAVLRNNHVQHIKGYGFHLTDSANTILSGNAVYNSTDASGINLVVSNNARLTNNTVQNAGNNGFVLNQSNSTTLTNNVAANNGISVTGDLGQDTGFVFYLSSYFNATGNNASANGYNGFYVFGGTGSALDRNRGTGADTQFYLDGDASNRLVSANVTNNLAYNSNSGCSCGDFYIYYGDGLTVSDNNATGVAPYGFFLGWTNNSLFQDNNKSGSGSSGFSLYASSLNNLTGNNISVTDGGIVLDVSPDNSLSSNYIRATGTSAAGIAVTSSSHRTTITSCRVSTYVAALTVTNSNNLVATGNTFVSSATEAVAVSSSNHNFFASNSMQPGPDDGVSLSSAVNNTFYLNNVSSPGGNGAFYVANSNSNNFTGNRITSISGSGFLLGNSDANSLYYNNVSGGSANYGISLTATSANNRIVSNDIYGTYSAAVNIAQGSNGNNLTGNDIHDAGGSAVIIDDSNSNALSGNTVHDNANGVWIGNTADSNSLAGNEIYNNAVYGVSINGASYSNALAGDHLYGNGPDFEMGGASGATVSLSGVIFDNPLGNYQNYTNLSISDSFDGSPYSAAWASLPAALPVGYANFARKFVEISTGGATSVDSATWSWLDSELGGYDESNFRLWEYNASGWTLLNNTPDTGANTLGLSSMNPASTYGILQLNDTVAPVVTLGSPANTSTFNVTTVELSFTATDDVATVLSCSLFINGALDQTNSSTQNGTLTSFTATGLADGPYGWRVECSDEMPNTGVSETRNFTIDTIAPAISFISYTDTSGIIVSRDWFALHVQATDANLANMTYWIYRSATLLFNMTGYGTALIDSTHNFTSAPDDIYFFNATAYDQAGHSSSTETRNVTLDTVPPSVTLNRPSNGSVFSVPAITFNFTAVDSVDLSMDCALSIDGSVEWTGPAANGTATTYTAPSILGGDHYWSVECTDDASNTGTSATWNFFVDTEAPVVALNSPANGATGPAGLVTFNFTATDNLAPYMGCILYVDGAPMDANGSTADGIPALLTATLAAGPHTWWVGCTDDASNTGVSATRNITLEGPSEQKTEEKHTSSLSFKASCDGNVVTFNGDGQPLADAGVVVDRTDNGATVAVGTTGRDGKFTFYACGFDVRIRASKSGYPGKELERSLPACGECTVECTDNSDCPSDKRCENGKCTAIACDCGYIQDHKCVEYGCCSDNDCSANERCEDHACKPHCVAPACCTRNGDCGQKEKCAIPEGAASGTCVPVAGCGPIEDHQLVEQWECGMEGCPACAMGRTCIDHKCVASDLKGPQTGFIGDDARLKATEGDNPCAACDLVVTDPTGRTFSGKSAQDGGFTLPLKLQGNYTVTLMKDGRAVRQLVIRALPRTSPEEPGRPTTTTPEAVSSIWLLILLVLAVLGLLYWRGRKGGAVKAEEKAAKGKPAKK